MSIRNFLLPIIDSLEVSKREVHGNSSAYFMLLIVSSVFLYFGYLDQLTHLGFSSLRNQTIFCIYYAIKLATTFYLVNKIQSNNTNSDNNSVNILLLQNLVEWLALLFVGVNFSTHIFYIISFVLLINIRRGVLFSIKNK